MTSAQSPVRPALAIFALAIGAFAIGTTEFATMTLLPLFAADLHIDAPTAGHVISAYALGVVVGAPIIASISARMEKRRVLILLMAVFALANGLTAFAPTYGSMMLFRFISGLPHGAYFGAAAIVASALVPRSKRTQAVGRMFLGLTVATIFGVPAANWLGQAVGWRWSFSVVATIAVTAMVMISRFAPIHPADPETNPIRELSALRRGQVWLTLATGAIGFGGLFAVYTYTASALLDVTHVSAYFIPVVMAAFGVGFTAGNIVVPYFADRALMPTAGALLIWSAAALAWFPSALQHPATMALDAFLIGIGGALGTVLQIRLMDVSGHAQALSAALNHSAFNTANALGPWLAGITIAAGYGWASAGWVGCALALAGLVFWAISVLAENMSDAAQAVKK
ncbi:MAG: MFS transporter [Xanthobacteraceae bacterium]|nr:MFS transporter [Xanthobacteraceae bacterium]